MTGADLKGAPRPAAPEPTEAPAEPRRRRPGRGARNAAVALVCLAVLWLARVPLLVSVADFLSVEDPLVRSDLVYVLGGDPETRTPRAAEIYHQGLAARVLLIRVYQDPVVEGIFPHQTEATALLLRRLAVPDSVIVQVQDGEGVTSTTEEAEALRRYLEVNPAERIIVVTNDYHTRRARWALRRALDGLPVQILMNGAPVREYDERNWWRSEEGMLNVFQEYLKFAHNWAYR